MADISYIITPSGDVYDIKDAAARGISQQSAASLADLSNRVETINNNLTEIVNNLSELVAQSGEAVSEYIRYDSTTGAITIGEPTSNVQLVVSNDSILIHDNSLGQDISVWSVNGVTSTEGSFSGELDLGNFAFIPQSDGSLRFNKVRG